jgi:hypothetical protein
MIKIYTIEILPINKNRGIWYASKVGNRYEAQLVCKNYDDKKQCGVVVFETNPCQFVFPIDCKIISEKTVEKYPKL